MCALFVEISHHLLSRIAVTLDPARKRRPDMQAFEVEFVPAHLSPLHVSDAIRAEVRPRPHVSIGDPATPGKGIRIPLTSRLIAEVTQGPPLISRARAFRDPKTGQIVLGVEQSENGKDGRALVLFAASSRFSEGVSISPQEGVAVLAKGQIYNGEQMLLLWHDGGKLTVQDSAGGERYELRRAGDQFDRVMLQEQPADP